MAKTKTLAKPAAKAAPTPVVERRPEIVRERAGDLTAERTAATSAMPPSNGEPSVQRAARILRFPGAGSRGRARMAAGSRARSATRASPG
ncbi:MAG: hypothetical protein GY856_33485 [bacterium]|nr:hypothetical protein [bacterium]